MEAPRLVVRCCICGREKTAQGWQFVFRSGNQPSACSHGVCEACYQVEIMKVRLRTAATAAAGR